MNRILRMRSELAIKRELGRYKKTKTLAPNDENWRSELRGIRQALAWVVTKDAMSPLKAAETYLRFDVKA